jgi:glycerol-3-phosphate acyltransferase PlsX
MHEPPALALRNKKDSSMRVAINLVKDGTAEACVSAGNTGALMAISRFVLKTLPGIDRPAIAGQLPTRRGGVVTCRSGRQRKLLARAARPVARWAALVDGRHRRLDPGYSTSAKRIRAASSQTDRRTAAGLRPISRQCRGNGIYKEDEVVVCDGFVGNVTLAEGLATMLYVLKAEFAQSADPGDGALLCRCCARSSTASIRAGTTARRSSGASSQNRSAMRWRSSMLRKRTRKPRTACSTRSRRWR